MLLTLEPMVHLPFDLSIDFESRHKEVRNRPDEEPMTGKTSIVNPSAEEVDEDEADVITSASVPPTLEVAIDQSPSQVRGGVYCSRSERN